MASKGKVYWTSWVISVLAVSLFVLSAILKLRGGPELAAGFEHMGVSPALAVPLAILELSCVLLYLIPRTAVLGGILLTGFLGGAILTHLRIGDPFYVHIGLGLLAWLGLYLREPRLRALLPLRS